jgi:hypothetical protein
VNRGAIARSPGISTQHDVGGSKAPLGDREVHEAERWHLVAGIHGWFHRGDL